MASMSHGPRTLPHKPGTATVPFPLVLTEDDFAELLHKKIGYVVGYCHHGLGAPGKPGRGANKACEMLAKELLGSGLVQRADVFVGSLKDNESVQQVILDAMHGAWMEGAHAQVGEDSPYGSR